MFWGHLELDLSFCSIFVGFHYINLKNELNQPLLLPSLLVYTEAQDYIPNEHQGTCAVSRIVATGAAKLLYCTIFTLAAVWVALEGAALMVFKIGFVVRILSPDRFVFSEYAEALTNPIKHISQLHKRETQLAVLLEDNSEVGNSRGTQGPPPPRRLPGLSPTDVSPARPRPAQRRRARERERPGARRPLPLPRPPAQLGGGRP